MTVADTGPGLSADELSWICTPFERLGAAQTTIEGTGIGLPLARALAQSHGRHAGRDQRAGPEFIATLDRFLVRPAG